MFNKKLISGSVRTANGAHLMMLCEGDINVDVITKTGDVKSGTLRVKIIPGMLGVWTMQGVQTNQGEFFYCSDP